MKTGNNAAAGARSPLVNLLRGFEPKHHPSKLPRERYALPEQAKRQIELVPLAQLITCKSNARTHSPKQISQIAASIERFGFTVPILVNAKNEIVAGHGRVEAAKLLGITEVPAVRLSHLSAVEQRAYVLADNKLAELAGWDNDTLAVELQGLIELDFPMEVTGFDMGEIELILHHEDEDKHDDGNESTGTQAKDPQAGSGPAVSQGGDVWMLGPHRLACGEGCDARAYAAVDAAIRRWQTFTGSVVTLAGSSQRFNEIAKQRRKSRIAARGQRPGSNSARREAA